MSDDDELSWRPAAPDVGGVEPSMVNPDAVIDEPVELSGIVWSGQRLVAITLDRPQVSHLRAADCDLSGVATTGGMLRRIALTGTRLRDCTFAGGLVQDATLDGCTGEGLSLRFSTLQRVVVTGSTLPRLDLYGATVDRVVFRDCDLTDAVFDGMTVQQLRLQRCTFTGITGAMSLRGAEIDFDDLLTLAPSLAKEFGLTLR